MHERDDAVRDGDACTLTRVVNGTWRGGWFVVPMDVQFRDIDNYGHVNNAIYFSYFEWARTLLWFELAGGGRAGEIGFIVAHAECDFRQQLSMEPIEVRIRVGAMRGTSLEFVSEIRRCDGEVAATGKVVVVLYDWETRSKRPISDELRQRVRSLQGE